MTRIAVSLCTAICIPEKKSSRVYLYSYSGEDDKKNYVITNLYNKIFSKTAVHFSS